MSASEGKPTVAALSLPVSIGSGWHSMPLHEHACTACPLHAMRHVAASSAHALFAVDGG